MEYIWRAIPHILSLIVSARDTQIQPSKGGSKDWLTEGIGPLYYPSYISSSPNKRCYCSCVYGRANYSGQIFDRVFDPAAAPASVPSSLSRRQSTGDIPLRILPLGASITWGLKSETGKGPRKYPRDQLRFDGWEVNMVGSKNNPDSTMVDKVLQSTFFFSHSSSPLPFSSLLKL